jgi:hypothetical protein
MMSHTGQSEEQKAVTGHQVLRDKFGNRIGEVQINGSKRTVRDKAGNFLGSYDEHDNWTRDKAGNPVGQGDLLTTLLR